MAEFKDYTKCQLELYLRACKQLIEVYEHPLTLEKGYTHAAKELIIGTTNCPFCTIVGYGEDCWNCIWVAIDKRECGDSICNSFSYTTDFTRKRHIARLTRWIQKIERRLEELTE